MPCPDHRQQRFKQLGLHHRATQVEMIDQVYDAISNKQILCIEAPTGTGKTLSYLIASYAAKKKQQKLIISTATIALQEQLVKKDLPLFEQIINQKLHYVLAKGRRNYLCLAKLEGESGEFDFFQDNTYLDKIRKQVATQAWDGDRETLENTLSDTQWFALTADSSECDNRECFFFTDCFFFKARQKLQEAEIIVTNHSLLLADLSLGGGVLLPEFENAIHVIDECHQLPQRAIMHFERTTPLLGFITWLDQLNSSTQRAISNQLIDIAWEHRLSPRIQVLIKAIKALVAQLNLNESSFSDNIWLVTCAQKSKLDSITQIANESYQLTHQINQINEELEKTVRENRENQPTQRRSLLKKYSTQLRFLLELVSNFAMTWFYFLDTETQKKSPIACWFEQKSGANHVKDYHCHCVPISAREQLKELFWQKLANSAVLCSATLRSLQSFTYFLRKSGLKGNEALVTHSIKPIFDYQRSVIFIPKMNHDPASNAQSHSQETIALLAELILPKSGTLVLFSSRAVMKYAYEQLDQAIVDDVLIQGKTSKSLLIQQHKEKIDAGERSVIFGLNTFAEGIDLPDNYCQHVIIHKLPFAVPSGPVELTRSAWLQQHQMNAFTLVTLPETSTKLTQYIGRLIRQEDDNGIVSILDRRLYTRHYGKQLLQSLPPFTTLIASDTEQLKQHPLTKELFNLS